MNEKLKFRLPTAEDAAEYISYRQAFLDAGSSMDGTGPMRRTPDPMEWLAINAQYADPATVPEGKVQSTQFVCERVSDGRIVGMLQVRLALNDYLLHYGGHIGYSVRPDERQQGIAAEHGKLVLEGKCSLRRLTVIPCLTDGFHFFQQQHDIQFGDMRDDISDGQLI